MVMREIHPAIDLQELAYRVPMRVSNIRCLLDSCYGLTSYPVCPRCDFTLERDFQRYCDRCGQALDWDDYSQALIILPDLDL